MRFGKNVWKHLEGTLWILSEQEGEKKFAGAPESSSCDAFSKSPRNQRQKSWISACVGDKNPFSSDIPLEQKSAAAQNVFKTTEK